MASLELEIIFVSLRLRDKSQPSSLLRRSHNSIAEFFELEANF